jgi:cytochrome bd-type quinol oxidase subunit 1
MFVVLYLLLGALFLFLMNRKIQAGPGRSSRPSRRWR